MIGKIYKIKLSRNQANNVGFSRIKCIMCSRVKKRECKILSENKFNQIKMMSNNSSTLEGLDLSNGFVCDFETGICGPADLIENNTEKNEETTNENNHLV